MGTGEGGGGAPRPLLISGRSSSPADLVVVDRDPVAVTQDELRQTGVIATHMDGAGADISRGSATWKG